MFPCRHARFGYAGRDLSQFRKTEVENLDHARVSDQQIRRLQIPMHDAFVVCRGQSACNLNRQLDRLADRQRAVLQPFLQRDAGEQFGNDIRRLLVAADVVDDKNVGVIERRSRASLLFEPPHPIRVGGKRRGQHFERDLTP